MLFWYKVHTQQYFIRLYTQRTVNVLSLNIGPQIIISSPLIVDQTTNDRVRAVISHATSHPDFLAWFGLILFFKKKKKLWFGGFSVSFQFRRRRYFVFINFQNFLITNFPLCLKLTIGYTYKTNSKTVCVCVCVKKSHNIWPLLLRV